MVPLRSSAHMITLADRQTPGMQVVILESVDDLQGHIPCIEDLLAETLEPNVFYEPWMLLPAVRYLDSQDLRFVLVYADSSEASQPRTLCGFFPMEREPHYRGLPLTVFRLWKHDYCFLCTPLLRASRAQEALSAFCDWLCMQNAGICEFGYISADGPFWGCLERCIAERRWQSFVSGCYQRPILVKPEHPDDYLRSGLFRSNLKSMARRSKHLAEQADVAYASLEAGEEVDAWIQNFLSLEASGWKGREGTAMACHDDHRHFFERITTDAFRRNQLMMTRLLGGGHPIAASCIFRTGRASFGFKVAFDEAFAKFSPGTLLELDNIRRFTAQADIDWVDSCAAPDHPQLSRLWKERRRIATVAFAVENTSARMIISILPAVRTWYHAVRRLQEGWTV